MYKLANFEKRQINVKSFIRKGRLVRSSKRKIDKRKEQRPGLKLAIKAASLIGVSLGTYVVLRKRYHNNLNLFAKRIKANPNIGEVLSDEVEDITFSIGGFAGGSKKAPPVAQSRAITIGIKNLFSASERKKHKFINLDHNFTLDLSENKIINNIERLKLVLNPLLKGKNVEMQKMAETIYSWHVKNPNKPINIVGFSAGGNMAREIKYILDKKGIPNKNINLGSTNFNLLPSMNSLEIIGKGDMVKLAKHNSSYIDDTVNDHDPVAYLKSEYTKKLVSNYLFSKPYTRRS